MARKWLVPLYPAVVNKQRADQGVGPTLTYQGSHFFKITTPFGDFLRLFFFLLLNLSSMMKT